MSLINVSNLTFGYEGSLENVFENVSFQLDTDWKLGFVGRNGKGKTTFLNLLLGKYEYSGAIKASVKFQYFPFEVQDKAYMTVELAENIDPSIETWQLIKELSFLGVDEDVLWRAFSTLSNGEQSKVLLAILFLGENNFLLIDEPTNHLDAQSRKKVSEYLKRKSGYILVSHDRSFLDDCVDHILWINNTDIEVTRGNFSVWNENKEKAESFEKSQQKKLSSKIDAMMRAKAQTADWSGQVEKTKYGSKNSGLRPDRGFIGHKSAKMMKRSKAIEKRQEKAIQEKSKLLKNADREESFFIRAIPFHSKILAFGKDLSVRYGEKIVFSQLNFEIIQGDKIALTGKNGSGKSSLIKLILEKDIQHSGELFVAKGLSVSYVQQDNSNLSGSLNIFIKSEGIDESRFKTILRKLNFERTDFEKNMELYSAGQKKKVAIAASLSKDANLFIWDEPLNFIDVVSRVQLEKLLSDSNVTMLFVEHDQSFLDSVATKFIKL